jgi:hypothetical protein
MPADDLIFNVRQIAGYPPADNAPASAGILMQIAGLGSAYVCISPAALVATALAIPGGDMSIGGSFTAPAVSGGSAQFSNGAFGELLAQEACFRELSATLGSIAGVPIATVADVAATVTSFNFRTGAVMLELGDVICAGGAPITSPYFWGDPQAPTPAPDDASNRLATTGWVKSAIATITLEYAPLDSPNFTGVPTAPTAAPGASDGQLATTAFVMNAVADSTTGVASFNGRTGAVVLSLADIIAAAGAPIAGPLFTGVPEAPTAALGTNTTQLATCAFVQAAVAAGTSGVSSFNTRTGAVTLSTSDITGAGGALAAATVASFNGRSGAVSLIANDISGASGALLASPAFTGVPTAPTAAPGTATTQIATTAFVASQTGFAPIASPAFTGTPTAPTAAYGTNSTQLATTAFVEAAVTGSTAGVASFNSRTGAVTLLANDISSAGGALLASPALTGTPSAPTAAASTNTTQLATCAFVMAAIAGFLPAANPAFTGSLTGPNLNLTGSLSVGTTALIGTTLGFNAGGGIVGFVNGSNAATGQVGEYLTTTSAGVPGSWNVVATYASWALPAGDWDVWGTVQAIPGAGAAITSAIVTLSPTAAALSGFPVVLYTPGYPAASQLTMALNTFRFVSTGTTVYCNASYGGTGTTLTITVNLFARRRR